MLFKILILVAFLLAVVGYTTLSGDQTIEKNITIPETIEIATFAGGCFWCIESAYEEYDGVYKAISGYTGGEIENPTYAQVAGKQTNHLEAVQVYYDPRKLSYSDLLEIYWRQIDPTDKDGSFVDRGHQYSSAIFYHDEEQKKLAQASLKKLNESKKI